MKAAEKQLERLEIEQLSRARYSGYGDDIVIDKEMTLHSEHENLHRFGYPGTAAGNARRELAGALLLSITLNTASPQRRLLESRRLYELIGSRETIKLRDAQRLKKLGERALRLNQLMEVAGMDYYIAGGFGSDGWRKAFTTTYLRGDFFAAKLVNFDVVDASENEDSHIEPVVESRDGQLQGLLAERILPSHAPLYYRP